MIIRLFGPSSKIALDIPLKSDPSIPDIARASLKFIQNKAVVAKLFDELGPKYQDRNGGYTRITRTSYRKGDGAELAVLELV